MPYSLWASRAHTDFPVSTPAADAFDAKSGFVRQPRVYGDVSRNTHTQSQRVEFLRPGLSGRVYCIGMENVIPPKSFALSTTVIIFDFACLERP